MAQATDDLIVRGYQAVETLYHAYLTGLILTVVTRRGRDDAAELLFRVFRRQHLTKFLPGLEKLGLRELPDAVAAAQYHYLANKLGGVKVEYMYESDRKAWVRFLPPRWIFDGTAICGAPGELSRAMLRAWYAHNGVTLGNPRLGFVCTKQTTDGQYGLEGYFYEYDHDLSPDERLRFAPGEDGPDFDPASAPHVSTAEWPTERLQKVLRNYTMEYIRSMLPEMMSLFGPTDGGYLAGLAGKLVGMQYYDQTAAFLGITANDPESFAEYLTRMGRAQGDQIEWKGQGAEIVIRQTTWRLLEGAGALPSEAFEAWSSLWEGALAVHNRRLRLQLSKRMDWGDDCFEWQLRAQGASKLAIVS